MESTLIWYKNGDNDDIKHWVDQLNEFIARESLINLISINHKLLIIPSVANILKHFSFPLQIFSNTAEYFLFSEIPNIFQGSSILMAIGKYLS